MQLPRSESPAEVLRVSLGAAMAAYYDASKEA
jgi:hypothetical protein